MEQEYIMRGLRQVAEAEGETVEKVMAEIGKIIDICWNSTDPLIRREWESIPRGGERPSVEELMAYLVGRVRSGK